MATKTEIKVPDIGDFDNVPVIEVLVAEGDRVEQEQSLLTLESDKATMEVPSPRAGKLVDLRVSEGDEVSEGDVIAVIEVEDEDGAEQDASEDRASDSEPSDGDRQRTAPSSGDSSSGSAPESEGRKSETDASRGEYDFDLVVLGSGPGGYTAAFRAADLGLKVALIERNESLGGVCLNVGCIPSKALLHVGQVIDSAAHLADHGVRFGAPEIDLDSLRKFKNDTVGKLTGGLAGMAKKRKVEVVTGTGAFSSAHEITVEHDGESRKVSFGQCILAAGSRVIKIPGIPWDDARVMDSTDALALEEIPDRLLIVGGGIIGLEMACVYRALGASVTVVELMDQLMPGADPDLVKPLHKHLESQGVQFHLGCKVAGVDAGQEALTARFEGDGAPESADFERVLVCVGRQPNGDRIGADTAGIEVTARGFIEVDGQMRTNVGHIFAIGDLVGQPMLAHKAVHEGHVAAEAAAGQASHFDARVIPSVAYTDPEVAWVGLTETEAKAQGIKYG
ncbi:MAG: dihydrolipoyl dehydrogenase, partial [Wenzhouxiangellaceae bacterium]